MSRILHVCLSNFFIDGQAYQENHLVEENARQGHEVFVLASRHINKLDGNWGFAKPGEHQTTSGVVVKRIPYVWWLPDVVGVRLRIHSGVYKIISDIAPDVIVFHGISGWEMLTVAKFCRDNPHVRLFADNHSDWLTAGRTWFTKWFLHFMYYRTVARLALKYYEKVLCISPMTLEYANKFYGIPMDKLELFPLGGRPVNPSDYQEWRRRVRADFGLGPTDILIVQSGKQYGRKYLVEALQSLAMVSSSRLSVKVAGVVLQDIKDEVDALVGKDARVEILPWLDPDELTKLLCAADIYMVPGRQTATTQHAMCCSCALILEDLSSNRPYVSGNGWLIQSPAELTAIFDFLVESNVDDLHRMGESSYAYAVNKLDYAVLSQRYITDAGGNEGS